MAEKILIDRGHGGSDPGAVGYVKEIEITHAWGAELANKIVRLGGNVYLLQDGTDANSDLSVPVNEANAYGLPWLYVSIHANAGGGTGYETYLYSGSWNNASTANLGWAVHNAYGAVAQKYGLANRGLKAADFYVLRTTYNRACLLELAFVDKQFDANLLTNATFRSEACEALARALMKEAGQTIVEPTPAPSPTPTEPDRYPLPAESKRYPMENGNYKFTNVSSGTVLECSLSHKVAQGWQMNGEVHQIPRWEKNTQRIIVTIAGKDYALDAVARKNGTQAIWYDNPHSGELEKWFIEKIGVTNSGITIVRIINVWTGRALDLAGGSKVNGTSVNTYNSLSTPSQYWYVEKVK